MHPSHPALCAKMRMPIKECHAFLYGAIAHLGTSVPFCAIEVTTFAPKITFKGFYSLYSLYNLYSNYSLYSSYKKNQ